MRTLIVCASIILLSLISNMRISSARRVIAPAGAAAQDATRFTGEYSALTRCGSGMTKREEREAEKHGTDIPTRFKGYGGYRVDISYSACSRVTAS